MKLFTLHDKKLKGISTLPFKLEKEIQTICENNLKELFELQFVRSEMRPFFPLGKILVEPALKLYNFQLESIGRRPF